MKKNLIIFGTGDIAQLANYYFESDSEYNVVGFTVDREFCNNDSFENKPLIAFDEVSLKFPPSDHSMFIAIAYGDMNKLRQIKLNSAKELGYSIASYVSSKATYLSEYKPG